MINKKLEEIENKIIEKLELILKETLYAGQVKEVAEIYALLKALEIQTNE
ncbi:MAG: hypothetical protein GWP19_03310 [Planctomycetia bacterium]|nr:hypothetical protein [Planctomycetia bacterium]